MTISLSQAFANWKDGGGMGSPFEIFGDDAPALSEAWNDYTDGLCKDGELTALQYHYAPAYDDDMPGEGTQFDALSDDREFVLDAMGVTMKVTRTASRDDAADWSRDASHWHVTIARAGKRMAISYSMGSAHTGGPQLDDVLNCVLRDAENAGDTFEDWCGAYGYDTDSRKAERMHRACRRSAASLTRLFNSSELDDLRELFADF